MTADDRGGLVVTEDEHHQVVAAVLLDERDDAAQRVRDRPGIGRPDVLAVTPQVLDGSDLTTDPLEDLVAHYEKGSALLARCESILKEACGRIELITLRNQEEIGLESEPPPGECADLSPEPAELPDDSDDDDDIRLF